MRIAVFGGSFDPVHIEHIRLVEAAIKSLRLDKLFVVPAHTAPHKSKRLTEDGIRLEMCKLAFFDIDKVKVSDYEMQKGGTSYTYLTCRYFKQLYPNDTLYWLVGTDMLRDFPTWKNTQSIVSDVTLAVCDRAEKNAWIEKEQSEFYERFGEKFEVIHYKATDVSSTKIRVLAGAGLRLTGLVPPNVAAYIEQNQVYAIPFAKEALSLEKQERQAHSVRVACMAVERAKGLKIPEEKALVAALFHDCGKNVSIRSPYLEGFKVQEEWGEVPSAVLHQFTGAYLAEKKFGITDEDILNAIRYHTSGRKHMSELEKLIYLSDMLEEGRTYEGVDELRKLFWRGQGLDECMKEALKRSVAFIQEKKEKIYPLTKEAYRWICTKQGTEV